MKKLDLWRFRRLFATALGCGGWVVLLLGAADRSPKISVVDIDRITAESRTIQTAITSASVEAQSLSEQMKAQQAEYGTAMQDYRAQQSVTSADENAKRVERLEALREEYEELEFRFSRAVKKAEEAIYAPVTEQIVGSIRSFAAQRGIDVVLTKSSTVYTNPNVDISDEIITRLDAR